MKFDQLCHRVDNRTLIYVSKPETTFAFRGRVNIQVLSGNINVLGFDINLKSGIIPIVSSSAYYAYTVDVLQNDGIYHYTKKKLTKILSQLSIEEIKIRKFLILGKKYCLIIFSHYEDSLSNCIRYFIPRIFAPKPNDCVISDGQSGAGADFIHFISMYGNAPLKVPKSWKELVLKLQEAFMQRESDMRIVVCGGKNSGKSTLLTFLVNSLLNECGSLYHLECDPGQPEFVPPGCLALTVIDKPMLEPTFLHQKKPLNCYFAGGVNITPFPKHYVQCIDNLNKDFKTHYDQAPKPLLINTMGFVRGIGLHLLADIFAIVKPTHVIQLQRDNPNIINLRPVTTEYLTEVNGWVNSDNQIPLYDYTSLKIQHGDRDDQVKTSKFLRELGMYSYLSALNENPNSRLLIQAVKPYKVAFSDVALFCCNVSVPNHEILYAMNGSLVALCRSSQFDELSATDSSLPKFLDKMPDGEWFGYGVVRGIDMNARVFYVVTPADQEDLIKVNVFLKTEIDLAERLVLYQKTAIPPPYVVNMQAKKSLMGNKVMTKRRFRERRGVFVRN